MKKFKIIVFNLLLLLFALLIVEGFNYYNYYVKTRNVLELKNNAGLIQKFRYTSAHKFDVEYYNHLFSKLIPPPPRDKRPILILGCSYAEGTGLEEKQTLAYKLFEKTGRSVYKRGIPGGGIQLALDMFETGVMKKEVPDAEYIIYVYVGYHIARLYSYQLDFIETEVNQRYKLKNNKLIKIKQPIFPFYYSLFTVKNIQQFIEDKTSAGEYSDYHLFNAVMDELLAQAKKNYGDVKFVILLYPSADDMQNTEAILPKEEIEKLESKGFIVLNAEDLTDKPIRNAEYRITDMDHPNEKAWDAIVTKLIQKLCL